MVFSGYNNEGLTEGKKDSVTLAHQAPPPPYKGSVKSEHVHSFYEYLYVKQNCLIWFLNFGSTVLHFLPHPISNPLHLNNLVTSLNPQASTNSSQSVLIYNIPHRKHFFIKCTSESKSTPLPEPDFPFPTPTSDTNNKAETFPIERRRNSKIIHDRESRTGLVQPEPPNFEIGWKRSKEFKLDKPKGYVIADFLEKLEDLMGKEFGSTELLAKAGEIMAERAREEAQVLSDKGEVEERMMTELFRVLRLMEMDLAMVKAAVKEETLGERLEQAKAHCRQAVLVALSFWKAHICRGFE
ncbi:protein CHLORORESPIRATORY REDUCTION 41, chloroplastic-like [Quercus robur]|uniref:protein CHLORORESPIRATORY REDUCTION 41, chloroplastic-like n=1 Tax=Quercus robur TaxID=38942 RepID=UPI002163C8C6|nr:protein CHLORORESPIRATORY REDUCTION 41, chloroplastic-like [Quercus robur]